MRTFLCIELSAEAKRALHRATADLRDSLGSLKWVSPESLHVTLKYLGELGEEKVEGVARSFEQAFSSAGLASFVLYCGNLGAFPRFERARVLIVHLLGELAPMALLASMAEESAAAYGVTREKHLFTPHITLARARSPHPLSPDDRFPGRRIEWLANSVTMMKSDLSPSGSIYTPLKRWKLGD
ncbi:MAG: RNA 2',3'-cyclic phosphodiesterase [Aminobacteriaceae bacterium]